MYVLEDTDSTLLSKLDDIKTTFSNRFTIDFINLDKKSADIEYYLLGISKYRTTAYYRSNTIPCFNIRNLVEKMNSDKFIIGIENKGLYSTESLEADDEFKKSMNAILTNSKTGFNLDARELQYIDNSLIVLSGDILKQYCLTFYENIGVFSNYIDSRLLISYIALFNMLSIESLKPGKQFIGNYKAESKSYKNHGYIYILNDVILQIVFDEKIDLDINVRCLVKDEKYYSKNGQNIGRNLDITEIKGFSI